MANKRRISIRSLLFVLSLFLSIGVKAQTEWEYIAVPDTFKHCAENNLAWSEGIEPIFEMLDSGRQIRIMQIGDSHIRGNYLSKAFNERLTNFFDSRVKKDSVSCISFTHYGINGAMAHRFLQEDMLVKVREYRPDLLIISFGTNEAHNAKYDENVHFSTLTSMLEEYSVNDSIPCILLTTPPGSMLSVRAGTYYTGRGKRRRRHYRYTHKPNMMTEKVVATMERFSNEKHIALWNLFKIGGGTTDAVSNWQNASLMQKDCIHYTAEGYTLQGKLLADAIIKAYFKYAEK